MLRLGIIGLSQVGKTTLLEQISQQYVTFDDENVLASANSNPKAFVSTLRSLGTGQEPPDLGIDVAPVG